MTETTPSHVALVRDFVNTLEVDTGEDALADAAALPGWLAARELDSPPPTRAQLRRARALREALRTLLLANNGVVADTAAACEVVEDAGRRARVELRFDDERGLVPAATAAGFDGVLGSLVAAAARSMHDGSWSRLKACRAETCRWAYYDQARNHSRAWCSMEVCGNREKVRAYRHRRAPA